MVEASCIYNPNDNENKSSLSYVYVYIIKSLQMSIIKGCSDTCSFWPFDPDNDTNLKPELPSLPASAIALL